MGEGDVEAVEHLEDVAEVGDGEDVGVEVERALEAGARHGVDARAEPDGLEEVDLGEGRVGEGGVGVEVDGEAGGDAGDRGGGAGGEGPVARRRSRRRERRPAKLVPLGAGRADLSRGGAGRQTGARIRVTASGRRGGGRRKFRGMSSVYGDSVRCTTHAQRMHKA